MSEGAKTEREFSPTPVPPIVVELERRLAFLELAPDDRERLRQLAAMLSESDGDFVKAFYDHLLSFADTARFLRKPELVERLKVAQQAHLKSMLEADWNVEYVARRRRGARSAGC